MKVLNENIKTLSNIFTKNNFHLYLVGGAIRDYLLGIENDDYDFATDANPEEVMSIFPHSTIPTGIKHGTVTVLFNSSSYEITTFRTEGDYADSRHPDNVSFTRDIATDLERRDFTINAIAYNVEEDKLIDLHSGQEDLDKKLIRAINDPVERFTEDALRMLRACRFSAKLDFTLEENTKNAIIKLKDRIKFVSAERIRDEIFKIIDSKNPMKGLELLRETGLLNLLLPEIAECIGVFQGGYHKDDVYLHSIKTLEMAKNSHFYVKLAALFHDIGKVSTKELKPDGSYSFYKHEIVGASLTANILKRLKCSNKEIEVVSHIIKNHMFNYSVEWTDSAIRRFILRVGIENLEYVYQLRRADIKAIDPSANFDVLDELIYRVNQQLENKTFIQRADLQLNGNDLIKLGLSGKAIGECLDYIFQEVIHTPEINEKPLLVEKAKEYLLNQTQSS